MITLKMVFCIVIAELQEIDSRPLSRKDIQILVGFGCPTTDKKVVFSSKLLRKRVHLDEGDVSAESIVEVLALCYILSFNEMHFVCL